MRWLTAWLPRRWRPAPPIPERLWQRTLASLPFLQALSDAQRARLRRLSAHFLAEKEFHGTHGLVVRDHMALTIAVQACLPLVDLTRPEDDPLPALAWYDDFVGIVLHPDTVLAQRTRTDMAGVVHGYTEPLAGEAMAGGPLMLTWSEVSRAGERMAQGANLVIHEFAHKLDMHGRAPGEEPQGAPALPRGFLGLSAREAQAVWHRDMQSAYAEFREAVALAERFGGEPPWVDPYAASAPAEFFAVTCEAYFVQPERFAQTFAGLRRLYDGFFHPHRPAG